MINTNRSKDSKPVQKVSSVDMYEKLADQFKELDDLDYLDDLPIANEKDAYIEPPFGRSKVLGWTDQ